MSVPEYGIIDEQLIVYQAPDLTFNMVRADEAVQIMLTTPTDTGTNLPVHAGYKMLSVTLDGQVVWEPVTSINVTPSTYNAWILLMTSGVRARVGKDTNTVWKLPTNNFGAHPMSSIQPYVTLLPCSRTLPTRVAYQGKTFSVAVEMYLSAPDPQVSVPVQTETWGPLLLPFQLLPSFITATTSIPDQEAITRTTLEGVTYTYAENFAQAEPIKTSKLYMFNTAVGNFMINNGLFVHNTPNVVV